MKERSAFWPCVWLGVALFATKAVYWSPPEPTFKRLTEYVNDLAVSTHLDLLFAFAVGALAQAALVMAAGRPILLRGLRRGLLAFGGLCVFYAVASVQIFTFLRSPLTYPLLYLAGDMRNMRSSIGSFVTPAFVAAALAAPVLYLLALRASEGLLPAAQATPRRWAVRLGAALVFLAYVLLVHQGAEGQWSDRDDRLIAENPHWVLASSCIKELLGGGTPHLTEVVRPEDLADFEAAHRVSQTRLGVPGGSRPRNVILIILESTGTRYLSVYGSPYDTTPRLRAEAAHSLVFDDFYCHVGMTANSMAAISLSIFPYMTWREYTVEYPGYPGRTLADLLHPLGFRTAFLHSGDLEYVQQNRFLANRGFDALRDVRDLSPGRRVSSWGGDDRILVDGVLDWIDQARGRPLYAMAWTIQSHHPYEPSPGEPEIDFFKGNLPPDDYDLGRYLNTVHQVDEQLGRLFDGLRRRGIADETLVVITADHGEAFGDPHRTWGHGAKLYEENVKVPLMIWSPRLYPSGGRSRTIGGHVDINPTIAEILGLRPAESWRGRSLFDPSRPPRAYFYAAHEDYLLGVREENWKYVYNATTGREELFDLSGDPLEQRNLAAADPDRCRRLRQRLAAWRDYAGRELARVQAGA